MSRNTITLIDVLRDHIITHGIDMDSEENEITLTGVHDDIEIGADDFNDVGRFEIGEDTWTFELFTVVYDAVGHLVCTIFIEKEI